MVAHLDVFDLDAVTCVAAYSSISSWSDGKRTDGGWFCLKFENSHDYPFEVTLHVDNLKDFGERLRDVVHEAFVDACIKRDVNGFLEKEEEDA